MTTKATTKKSAVSLEASIYSQKAASAGKITLPESVFGLKWNADLVHQVVVSMMSNKRAGTAHTKDRSEVSGGGKKPWKQKGTGRSRHGSTRSPVWVGGGVTFGPRAEKDYSKKINKKMRVKALYNILSRKYGEGKVLFVDSLSLDAMKTKDATAVLASLATISGFEKLGSKKPTTLLIAMPDRQEVVEKSFANLPGVTMTTVAEMSALTALSFGHIVVVNPEAAVATLSAKMK